jgi:hypothetical protein
MTAPVPEPLARHAPALLLAGCCALYACSRLLATLVPRPRVDDDGRLGLRALAYFVPIAFASVVALLLGRPEIAVGIVFGTSVGAVTTVVGFIALAGPVDVPPPRFRRLWPFLLAAGLLVLVAGFGGIFKWREAVAMLTQGLLLLTLWNDRDAARADREPATTHEVLQRATGGGGRGRVVLNYQSPVADPRRPADWVVLFVELSLLATLCWFGAWMVTQGAVRAAPALRGLSTSATAASIISLALVLPMTHGTWNRASAGHGWAPVTTQRGDVFQNLCAQLPIHAQIP